MKRRLIKAIKGESGQALPIVLVLLGLGGLLIAPSLNYASTSLNAGQIVEKEVNGLYAADAGVEYALWYIVDGSKKLKDLKKLPENVNQLEVKIKAKGEKGTYTLYYGELIKTGKHSDYLDVSGEMVWNELAEAYKYTITVSWQAKPGTPNIKLEEIGVMLPVDYSYQTGSAASFPSNLSKNEPVDTLDEAGAHVLDWEFSSPRPDVSEEDPTRTQTFYITGEESEEEPEGDYTWVVAAETDIDIVGEIVGELYKIESTANVPGEKGKKGKKGEEIAKVEACVLKEGEEEEVEIHIISWEIIPLKKKK